MVVHSVALKVSLCWRCATLCSVNGRFPMVLHAQIRYKQKNTQKHFRKPHIPKEKVSKIATKKLMPPFEDPQKVTDSEFLERQPTDNVWLRKYFPRQKYTVYEAIKSHQEYAQPALFDNLSGIVFADLSLNMATNKKTKFLRALSTTVLPPHLFDYQEPNRCLVFCEEEEHVQEAMSSGALEAGGEKLINMVLDNSLTKDDYEVILATPDMAEKMVALRNKLRDLTPSESKGTMSYDIPHMVRKFTYGITIESQPTRDESVNRLQLPVGQMGQSTEELVANFQHYLACIGRSWSPKGVGDIVLEALFVAPPSPEKFFILPSETAIKRTKLKRSRRKHVEEEDEAVEEPLAAEE